MYSIHIVRRYGPVGGMENYVYQLTQALVRQGQRVTVLCEQRECDDLAGIDVVELGNGFRKPRWLAQWVFSKRVSGYIEGVEVKGSGIAGGVIIHSHERTAVHHVTTFHGPPFVIRKHRLLDVLSPRIHMWSYLEHRELTNPQVAAILPNSPMIAGQLKQFYPTIANKVREPAYPGVESHLSSITRQSDGLTIGFLGREWKRKGLDIACRVIEKVRETEPKVRFVVAGCDKEDIAHLFAEWSEDSYSLLGWIADPTEFLAQVDLLLHPARSEPFGMAIAEANATSIPVVVSEHCGVAALVGKEQGAVCPLDLGAINLGSYGSTEAIDSVIESWAKACVDLLQSEQNIISMNLSWDGLATQHIALYQEIREAEAIS